MSRGSPIKNMELEGSLETRGTVHGNAGLDMYSVEVLGIVCCNSRTAPELLRYLTTVLVSGPIPIPVSVEP